MTKKRFIKLARAYFTRLNEWGKEHGYKSMNMGVLYSRLEKLANETAIDDDGRKLTRAEWWALKSKYNSSVLGVGVKGGK